MFGHPDLYIPLESFTVYYGLSYLLMAFSDNKFLKKQRWHIGNGPRQWFMIIHASEAQGQRPPQLERLD